MAIRSDISVDWSSSPRIITVLSPSTEVTMQDLYDTLRSLEDDPDNMDNDYIVSGSGKENLGGGVYVGLTVTLNNAQLAFEARLGPSFVQCNVTGGNLVAVNSEGIVMSSIYATDYTQVILTSSSSATLQELDVIQYASYSNGVWIDVCTGSSGTAYPIGTPLTPVNNLANAKTIAANHGFVTLNLLTGLTVADGEDISNLTIKSDNWLNLILEENTSCDETLFEKVSVYGPVSGGWNVFTNCWVFDVSNFAGWLVGGSFENIVLAPYNEYSQGQSFFDNCTPMYPSTPSVLVLNVSTNISFTSTNGDIEIRNSTSDCILDIEFAAGSLTIDNTCIGGDFTVRGIGELTNNSLLTVNSEGLMSKTTVAEAVYVAVGDEIEYASYNGGITIDVINGSDNTVYPVGTPLVPCKTLSNFSTISAERGLNILYVIGDISINIVDISTLSARTIIGQGVKNSLITINNAVVVKSITRNCKVEGICGNGSSIVLYDCEIGDFGNISLDAYDCVLSGTVELNNTISSNFYNCVDGVPGSGTPVIQVNDCESLGIWSYSGGIKITNTTTPGTNISLNMKSGRLIVDSTNTEGSIIVRGVGSLVGTTGGTTINQDGLIDNISISKASLKKILPFLFAK